MAEEDIVQNIKVNVDTEGLSAFDKLRDAARDAFDAIKDAFSGDFGSAFDKIKDASANAFDAVKEAASQSFNFIKEVGSGSLSELSERLSAAGVTFGRVAIGIGAGFAAVAVAVAGAGFAIYKFVSSASEAVNALGRLSDKTQTSVSDLSSMQASFAKAGITASEFASSYSKLSNTVSSTWERIKKDTADGANDLESKSIAAARAQQRLLETQREASGNRPDTNTKLVEESLAKELSLREAVLAAKKADKAAEDARKNDIGNITKGVQDLIAGNESALNSFNATADNIVRGVVAAAGQGSEALAGLGENFAAVGSKAPGVQAVLATLGEALRNIEDPALRTKVAMEALGPAGDKFLRALDTGKVDDFGKSLLELGNGADEADRKIAGKFTESVRRLGSVIDNIKTSISAAFGSELTRIIESLGEVFERNQETIRTFADLLSSVLLPPLKLVATGFTVISETVGVLIDVLRQIGGLIVDFASANLDGIIERFTNLYDIVKALGTILSGDVKKGLDDLAKARDDVAKTDRQREEAKRKESEDEVRTKQKPDDQDVKDSKLKEDFEQFKAQQPPDRFVGQDPSPDVREAIDFAKFKDQQPQQPEPTPPEENPFAKGLDVVRDFFSTLNDTLKSIGQGAQQELGLGETPPEPELRSDAADQALQSVASSAESTSSSLTNVSAAAESASVPVQSLASAAEAVPGPLQSLVSAAEAAAAALSSVQPPAGGSGTAPVAVAAGGWIRGPGTETSDSIPALLSHNEFVQPANAVRHYGVAFMEAVRKLQLPKFADGGLVTSLQRFANGGPVSSEPAATASSVQRAFEEVGEKIKEIFSEIDTTNTVVNRHTDEINELRNNGGEEGFAAGGWIRGRGTETSDSIPAWLSDNEFVQPARATRHYGVEFMESIRNLQFPKFADGGIVNLLSPQLPRFAVGGRVSADSAVVPHLGTVDLRTDYGRVSMSASPDAVAQLQKAAVTKRITSTGRKPGFVG
jgi:hypothetical protein